eukprot:54246-Pelagomonas_calceolata.AAC.1
MLAGVRARHPLTLPLLVDVALSITRGPVIAGSFASSLAASMIRVVCTRRAGKAVGVDDAAPCVSYVCSDALGARQQ